MSTALRHPTSLTLRRFIHRVMDTARRVPVPAVEWDDIRGASYLAPAAMKVLGCMHLFASYEAKMEGRYPWYSGDAGMYEETMQVQVFRQYLAPLGREFFDKYSGLEPASLVNRLSADDMTRFRDCLGKAWQELQELSSVIPSNKRLYDEMFKTRRSLEAYLMALRAYRAQLRPLPPLILGFNRDTRVQLAQHQVAGFTAEINPRFPMDQLNEFQRASKFVARIKAVFQGQVKGHLQWLTQHVDGTPRCVLLLFVTETSRLEALDLQRLWADHILSRHESFSPNDVFGIGCEVERGPWISGSDSEVWGGLMQWIRKMMVDPLTYQRLKLPPGNRFWSKSRL